MTSEAPSPSNTPHASRQDDLGPLKPFEALYRAARAAAEVRDEQLAVFAHDLRNPMNALGVSAEVLQRAPPGSPEAMRAAAIIARQVARLTDLINLHLPSRPPPSLRVDDDL